jgi:hypothetical protein
MLDGNSLSGKASNPKFKKCANLLTIFSAGERAAKVIREEAAMSRAKADRIVSSPGRVLLQLVIHEQANQRTRTRHWRPRT